jgi:hypothetical protein
MVPANSHRISLVPRYSGYLFDQYYSFCVRDYHPLRYTFPGISTMRALNLCYKSFNPGNAVTLPVWAPPRSLATTCGITIVFFSYGYLDVSVPHVRLPSLGYPACAGWVAPFGHLRIKGYLHLPEAFRSLSRPSSPLRAKASAIRPYLLSSYSYSSAHHILLQCAVLLYIFPVCQRSLWLPAEKAGV